MVLTRSSLFLCVYLIHCFHNYFIFCIFPPSYAFYFFTSSFFLVLFIFLSLLFLFLNLSFSNFFLFSLFNCKLCFEGFHTLSLSLYLSLSLPLSLSLSLSLSLCLSLSLTISHSLFLYAIFSKSLKNTFS
jgi:hypothetical protein